VSEIRVSVSAGDEADLDVRIERLTAALGPDTEVTVARGIVFNRHGMPPSPAAILSAVPRAVR
jgi:hypothetical protein